MIYLAREITRARYIENDIGWYISLEKLLKRDILKMILVDISCSRNYSSEIYIKNGIRWYISLKKLLVHDISKMGLFDISCSSYYSSEIYQKWDWLIYLAKKFLEQDISKIGLVDISRSRNFSSKIYCKVDFLSKIYQPIPFLIYLVWEIFQARYINFFHFFIYLAWEISRARYINFFQFFIYLAWEISWARNFKNQLKKNLNFFKHFKFNFYNFLVILALLVQNFNWSARNWTSSWWSHM